MKNIIDGEVGYKEIRGTRISGIPETPGLYSWYYRPAGSKIENIVSTLNGILNSPPKIRTEVVQRYGVRYVTSETADLYVGADYQNVSSAISSAVDKAEEFLGWFFKSDEFVHFCRPVYIGIANNLHERVYRQHYSSLIEYWDPDSSVSKFLGNNAGAVAQDVMNKLDLPHSFALEARVSGIAPQDLMVSILPTDKFPDAIGSDLDNQDDTITRRSLERVLHLLSDPVFGRR